jgi:hypothetical protein
MELKLRKSEILVLRNVKSDMTSRNAFKYPQKGKVEAPDWIDNDKCGNGLHGLPWGCGGVSYFYDDADVKWLVIKVDTSKDYKSGKDELSDKCKFKKGIVIFCGKKEDAVALIQKYAPPDIPINLATQTAGDRSTQTAGDRSTQTAGDESTQTAGDESTQKAGYRSTQTAGYMSTQTAGYNSVQIINWYDGDKWTVSTRVITKEEADKPYKFKEGKWVLIKK